MKHKIPLPSSIRVIDDCILTYTSRGSEETSINIYDCARKVEGFPLDVSVVCTLMVVLLKHKEKDSSMLRTTKARSIKRYFHERYEKNLYSSTPIRFLQIRGCIEYWHAIFKPMFTIIGCEKTTLENPRFCHMFLEST